MSSSSPTTTTKPAKQQDDADGASHTEARGVAADGSAVANSYKLRGSCRARAHPAAKVFPLLKDDGIDLLAEDIKNNGLQSAVAIQKTKDGDYLVLDGRNRLRACELVRVEPDGPPCRPASGPCEVHRVGELTTAAPERVAASDGRGPAGQHREQRQTGKNYLD